ncbi:MAG: hypothetical protein OEW39_15315, partial [Deltaproteobacteria bacterium]|nr:hypothetical protein [Deltaproteobacteria bacterium]
TALVAGNAFAQFTGDVNTSFGRTTRDDNWNSPLKGGSKFEGGVEMNFRGAGGDGAVTGGFRIRLRDDFSKSVLTSAKYNDGTASVPAGNPSVDTKSTSVSNLSAFRGFINWALSDALSVKIHGRSYGLTGEMGNADRAVLQYQDGLGTDDAANDFFFNSTGISVVFKGPVQAEAGIFNDCRACPGVASTHVRAGSQSIGLGLTGSAGAISYNVIIKNAGSVDMDKTGGTKPDNTPKTAFMGFGVGYAGGAFNVNVDHSSLKTNAGTTGAKDSTNDVNVVGLDAAGAFLSYMMGSSKAAGAKDADAVAEIVLGYNIVTTAKGKIVAEYRSVTNTPGGKGAKSSSANAMMIGGTTKF